MPAPSSNEQTAAKFFTALNENEWKCKCGKTLTQKKGIGWSNLMAHIRNQNSELLKKDMPNSLTSYFQSGPSFTRTGLNYYGWIEWVCCDLLPFNFVEKELTRKYTNLAPILRNTLIKFMEQLTKRVEKEIAKDIPENFCLVIDGWTSGSEHFVGIFASYPTAQGFSTALLGFSPLQSESSFTASDHYEYIEYVLSLFGKSVANLIAFCGDNAEINKCLANLLQIPLIGCNSHKFNIAVSKYLNGQNEIIEKVSSLMVKLRSPKLTGELRQFTKLRPVLRNKTRWTSTMDMILRYFEINRSVENLPSFNKILDYIPMARENKELEDLKTTLPKLKSVTKALQREKIDLYDVRVLFDEVLKIYRTEEFSRYLRLDCEIVHSPNFEKAIIKLLKNEDDSLLENEKQLIKKLRLVQHVPDEDVEVLPAEDEEDFAGGLLKVRKLEKRSRQREYIDPTFILPTSNILEQFFSTAGFAYTDYRKNLQPVNLEMQLFMKINHKFWQESTVDDIVNDMNNETA